jgi:F0F1-type ATP synthase membrane subunit b/b'
MLRDFLDRFRPAGAPGAAGRAGVPADRARELSAELEPVLALLAETDAECGRIVAQAQHEASRIADEARDQAAGIAADGQHRAAAARDAAAERVMAAARQEAGAAVRAAAEQARSRRRLADWQVNELVAAAVDLVRSLPAEGAGPAGGAAP